MNITKFCCNDTVTKLQLPGLAFHTFTVLKQLKCEDVSKFNHIKTYEPWSIDHSKFNVAKR